MPPKEEEDERDYEFEPAIVIDNGSGILKGGFAGEDSPRVSEHAIFSQFGGRGEIRGRTDLPVGNTALDDAYNEHPEHYLEYPMQRGVIDNMGGMEALWDKVLMELQQGDASIDMPVLLSEAAGNPPENRQEMAEVMFEKYKAPALYFANQPVLDLFSTGRTTGLVLDIGHGVTQAAPVFNGFTLSHAVSRSRFGGMDLTNHMQDLLDNMLKKRETSSHNTDKFRRRTPFQEVTSLPFGTIEGYKLVNCIKESLCSVALDFKESISETDGDHQREFILPDKTVITIGPAEIYSCAEALFNPQMISSLDENQPRGIHEHLVKVYNMCDEYIKPLLADNVVLAGGSSMFLGIKPRLELEFNKLMMQSGTGKLATAELSIDCQRERHHACWVGGSMLASLSTFKDIWISKADYDESGKSIIFAR